MKEPMNETTGEEKFQPQPSLSKGAQFHRFLRDAIIRGDLKPGQAISEIEMSKQYGLSRQPVREAFIKLSDERLIDVLPQRGSYVRKISVKEVLEARYLREIIEVSLVREVAKNPSRALIAQLRRIIGAQRKVKPGDSRSFLALDDEFHKAFAMHAGREYTWRVTEAIKAQLNRARFLSFDFAELTADVVSEHATIVDAIEAGDADLAAAEMEKHLRSIFESLPLMAKRFPDHFTDIED